jgi:hypothetical protein
MSPGQARHHTPRQSRTLRGSTAKGMPDAGEPRCPAPFQSPARLSQHSASLLAPINRRLPPSIRNPHAVSRRRTQTARRRDGDRILLSTSVMADPAIAGACNDPQTNPLEASTRRSVAAPTSPGSSPTDRGDPAGRRAALRAKRRWLVQRHYLSVESMALILADRALTSAAGTPRRRRPPWRPGARRVRAPADDRYAYQAGSTRTTGW